MANGADLLKNRPVFRIKGITQPKDVELRDKYCKLADVDDIEKGDVVDDEEGYDEECHVTGEAWFNEKLAKAIKVLCIADKDDTGKYLLDESQIDELGSYFLDMLIYLKGTFDVERAGAIIGTKVDWSVYFPDLLELIKAMLFVGDPRACFIVKDFFSQLESIKTDDIDKTNFLIGIARKYAEVADYYLLFEGRTEITATYYRMVVEIISYTGLDACESDERQYYLGIQEAFFTFGFLFKAIKGKKVLDAKDRENRLEVFDEELALKLKEGNLIDKEIDSIIKEFLAENRKILEKDTRTINITAQWEFLWGKTCELYSYVSKAKFQKNSLEMKRLGLGAFYLLLGESIVYGLYNQEGSVDKKRVAEIYPGMEFLQSLDLSSFKSVDDYIEKRCLGKIEAFEVAFDIAENVDLIRKLLEACPLPEELAYYTALSTLEYLLPISAEAPKYGIEKMKKAKMSALVDEGELIEKEKITSMVGRYSLMNVGHMNDPMEGKTLLFRLFKNKNQFDHKAGISNRYVFLKSFTDRVDDIPMWVMYGCGAEGCCVVLDRKRIIMEGNYDLAKVCYLRESEGTWKLEEDDNKGINSLGKIEKHLNILEDACEKYLSFNLPKGESEVIDLLDPILYLFKSATYCHENEYRIIENTDHYDTRICYTTEKNGGRIYIPSKQRTYIKKIILGPKFKSVEDTLPYLDYRCRFLAEELNMDNNIEIKVSDADFI